MRKLLLMTAAVSALSLTGCIDMSGDDDEASNEEPVIDESASKAAMLVGGWDCDVRSSSMESGSTMEIEYLKDGRSTAQLELHTTHDDGGKIVVDMMATGTWEIDGDMLIEEITDADIVNANYRGGRVTDRNVISDFEDGMEGKPASTEIVLLTENKLRTVDGDARASCTRA